MVELCRCEEVYSPPASRTAAEKNYKTLNIAVFLMSDYLAAK